MTKMRAVQVTRPGGPLELVQREIPEPATGSVRIRVEACGVCHSDAFTKEGHWPGVQYPRVPGHEVAGVIDAPEGISGQALTGRAFVQAQKFGAEIMIPSPVVRLDCATVPFAVEMVDGRRTKARTIVVACGARYRRPPIPNLEAFEGRGVWYWASPIEARLCREEHVGLVGGGNSAGQAAVFLSGFAAKVSMLVRDDGLESTMSRYLIDRIEASANIEVLTRTEIVMLAGGLGSHLERVRWRRARTGEETEVPIRNVFLFVGVEPATGWLEACGIALDAEGFVRTGSGDHQQRPLPLESNVLGVFAVGDVRSGSTKRVGGAIGEGAAVVPQLHTVLAEAATLPR